MEYGDNDDIPFTDEALRNARVVKRRAVTRLPLVAQLDPNGSVYIKVKLRVNGKQIQKHLGKLTDTFTLSHAAAHAERLQQEYRSKFKDTERLVYVLRDIRNNLYKIGITLPAQLKGRLDHLACGNPYPLELVATFPGDWHVEQALHKRFQDAHFFREWFRPTPELRAWLKEIAS